MKKVKRITFAMLLVLTMFLAACGGAEKTGSSSDAKSEGTNSEQVEQKDAAAAVEHPKFLTVAGATSGGTYFLLANALAQLFGNEFPDIDTNAQSTPGSPVILENINKGDAELGIAQAGVADDAYNGKGQFEGKSMENIRQLTYFFPNVMQFVVRKDAGIDSIEGIAGKTVAVGAAGSATELNMQDLIAAIGLTYDDIKAEYVSEAQSVELLRNRQADAANMIASLGSAAMLDILSTGEYEVIEIPEEIVKQLSEEVNQAYYPFTIPANTYPNQPEPVETFAVANWLHVSSELSDEFVYELLETIYDNLDFLVNTHKVAENISLENALDGQTIPLHDGAIKFYEDKGIEVKN
ncbi:TAXI family TRAP transporter solute-binding subunit [bacterium LRH843]|nr:TAXI family TRAP transporter solute-binding subunit [bacterium LRH843]